MMKGYIKEWLNVVGALAMHALLIFLETIFFTLGFFEQKEYGWRTHGGKHIFNCTNKKNSVRVMGGLSIFWSF